MRDTQVIETLFKAGKDAHDKGVLRCQAPYNKGSSRYTEWVAGWDAALKANHGDKNALKSGVEYVRIGEAESDIEMSEDLAVLGDVPGRR